MDHATLSRLELERKVELLMDEIGFLKKLHEEVGPGRDGARGDRSGPCDAHTPIQELRDLEGSAPSPAGLPEAEMCKPELTAALREIRTQYESIAVKNLQEAEEWYKSKVPGAGRGFGEAEPSQSPDWPGPRSLPTSRMQQTGTTRRCDWPSRR